MTAKATAWSAVALAIFVFSTADVSSSTFNERVEACEQNWASLIESSKVVNQEFLSRWKSESVNCSGTGVYEYRLASAHAKLREYDEAIAIYESAQGIDGPYTVYLRTGLYSTKSMREAMSGNLDFEAHEDNINQLSEISREHPDALLPLMQLANTHLLINQYKPAYHFSKSALSTESPHWGVMRVNLVSADHIDQCQEATPYIRPAIELNEALIRDADFMLAVASCYQKTGKSEAAMAALNALRSHVPSVKQMEKFQAIYALASGHSSERDK